MDRAGGRTSLEAERFVAAALIEVIYAVLSRVFLPARMAGVELELWVTALRVGTVMLYWLLFRSLVLDRRPIQDAHGRSWISVIVLLVLSAAVAVADFPLPDMETRFIFAATGLIVALREELLYRGAIFNALEQRLGLAGAVILSSFIFVLGHWGALPINTTTVIELFAMGCVYALLYALTGSLLFVVALHFAYDAIYALSPLSEPLPRWVGNALQLAALAVAGGWAARHMKQRGDPA